VKITSSSEETLYSYNKENNKPAIEGSLAENKNKAIIS